MHQKNSYTKVIESLGFDIQAQTMTNKIDFINEKTAKIIEQDNEKIGIPGFSAALITGKNQITPFCRGKSLKGQDLDKDSQFQAASLSKPVFAYLVLRLIASQKYTDIQGQHFDLDTRLDKIFSEQELEGKFQAGKDEVNNINLTYKEWFKSLTPRMLLSHTAGFPIYYDPSKLPPFQFEPGTRFCYSGPGIALLQEAVDKITGSNLQTLAQQFVFDHCAMSNSTFEWDEETKAKKPQANLKPNAANSLKTTASDYANFIWEWMHDKTIPNAFAPQKSMKTLFTPEDWLIDATWQTDKEHEIRHKTKLEKAREQVAWGLGIGLQVDNSGTATAAYHNGDMDEYRAFVAVDLQNRDKAIVYFANSFNGFALVSQIINPQIPLEHAFHHFSQTFGFALNVDELENNFNKLGLQPSRSQRLQYAPEPKHTTSEILEEPTGICSAP
jgi:CubicO group peptidase (beta-lactamase class C family)